jgi:hypothetical protein
MVRIEHIAAGWKYEFDNDVAGNVGAIVVGHDGSVIIGYKDGTIKCILPE